jgi:hypothetical protein
MNSGETRRNIDVSDACTRCWQNVHGVKVVNTFTRVQERSKQSLNYAQISIDAGDCEWHQIAVVGVILAGGAL